ncbi:hypothetical protein LPB27_01305 [Salmonella enterica subsp. enterica]
MLTVQKKTFSLAGMSPKSSNMTAKSGINTADTSKVYHLLVVGADALTMSEITVDGVSVEKVSGCAREFLVVDHLFCSCSDSTKTFVHVRDVNEMSAMYCASGASNSEFSESIKRACRYAATRFMVIRHLIKRVPGLGPRRQSRRYMTRQRLFCIGAHAHLINGGLYGADFGQAGFLDCQ